MQQCNSLLKAILIQVNAAMQQPATSSSYTGLCINATACSNAIFIQVNAAMQHMLQFKYYCTGKCSYCMQHMLQCNYYPVNCSQCTVRINAALQPPTSMQFLSR